MIRKILALTPAAACAPALAQQMEPGEWQFDSKGSARYGRGTLESEMRMSGEMQGRKFDMTTKTSGKRLGPCKS